MSFLREYKLKTDKEGAYNITQQITDAVRESGVVEGMAFLYCPHTTAGVTVTENTDPQLTKDMLYGMAASFPDRPTYAHAEGNAFAHIKSSILGCQLPLAITGGWPLLGPFQAVFFCEFDGPRERRFYVKCWEC